MHETELRICIFSELLFYRKYKLECSIVSLDQKKCTEFPEVPHCHLIELTNSKNQNMAISVCKAGSEEAGSDVCVV